MVNHSRTPLLLGNRELSQADSRAALSSRRTTSSKAQEDVTQLIGWLLQAGVLLSAVIILAGVALLVIQPGGFSTQAFQGFPRSLSQVWNGLLALKAQSIIVLGLLVLIATPVVRVVVSVIAFAIERDRAYVLITLLVLAILLVSIFLLGGILPGGHPVGQVNEHLSFQMIAFIFAGSIVAGLLGSLVGLGGGVLIVPMLTLAFGLPISYAIGASIISVIATSSGAAAAYVRDHITNMRVGMFLEIATTTGAICGALLTAILAPELLFIIFGIILLISALPLIFKIGEELPQGVTNDRWARTLRLSASYPDHYLKREVSYQVTRTPAGMGMMYVAGIISGLLGIGSGTFKVIAMDILMRLPMKVSTTTSNFMIGVTAAASAGIYFARGDISPMIAAPVALGVLVGAFTGSHLLTRLSNRALRLIFLPVMAIIAIQMVLRGFGITI